MFALVGCVHVLPVDCSLVDLGGHVLRLHRLRAEVNQPSHEHHSLQETRAAPRSGGACAVHTAAAHKTPYSVVPRIPHCVL